jgi:hypothetical protein
MTRREVQSLQDIARANGGSLSINPETGLVEAGFLSNLLPMIAGAALTAATGGAAAPWMIGLGVGGIQAARTGSLQKGLMAGLGAYGGSGLMSGLTASAATTGTPITGQAASKLASTDMALGGQGGSAAASQYLPSAPGAMSGLDTLKYGVQGLGTEAGRSAALGSMGGGFGAAKTAGAALAPVLMGGDEQEAPPADNEQYNYEFNPGRVENPDEGYTGAFTGERTHFRPSYTRLPNTRVTGMRDGGDVKRYAGETGSVVTDDKNKTTGLQAAAANQGVQVPFAQQAALVPAGSIQPIATNPFYTMTGASGDAYKYLMGQKGSSGTTPTKAVTTITNTDTTTGTDTTPRFTGTTTGINTDFTTFIFTDTDTDFGTDTDVFTYDPTDTDVFTYDPTDTDVFTFIPTDDVTDTDVFTYVPPDVTDTDVFTYDPTDTDVFTYIPPDVTDTDVFTYVPPDVTDTDIFTYIPPDVTDTDIFTYIPPDVTDTDIFTYIPPDVTDTATLTDGSYFDDVNSPDIVGPRRGGGGDLDESFDEYLSGGGNNGFDLGGSFDFRGGDYGGGGKYFDDQSMATMAMASGGMTPPMIRGLSDLGGYSDGGRLLRGPGDGVSDSIPATINNKQPARLADGEFVVPARIVSELGNGSTEAGARKLYAMMERIQTGRRKTVGKNRVATNSRADRHLPA